MTPISNQLRPLVAATRAAVAKDADWAGTAELVAAQLRVTWCVFGVVQGVEHEELYTLDESRGCLVEAGVGENRLGEVSGFAPPGDIHRVRNDGETTAISIHVYGTDVSRIGSSVRRLYELPIDSPLASAA
jgi:predicted metal-dependent enzyme (double-stranded beta helix superfamily)